MFSDLRQMAIASQYVDDLVDETNTSGFLPEEGWQAIESIYGVTKAQFESEGFGSEELKRIRTEYNANKEAGMTEGIISILTSLSGEDRGVVLNAFKRDGAGLEGLGLGGRADLRSLIGITGFKVDNEGKASIDLSSSYGTYSLKDAAAKAVERTKRTADSTMIESILGLRPGAKLTQQQQEWINANSEFAAMYNARQERTISKDRFEKYATQKQTGSPLDYDYYSTMLGADTDTIAQTLEMIQGLKPDNQVKTMYLSMLEGLGEHGKTLADAIRGNDLVFEEGKLTGTNAETLDNLVNDLSDMQTKELFLNAPWLNDYLEIVTGLRSTSKSTRAGAASTAFAELDQVRQAGYYMQQLNANPDQMISEQGYETLAAVTGFKADEIKKMGKSQAGRSVLSSSLQDASATIDKMLGLAVQNSLGDDALLALTELGDNATTEQIVAAFNAKGINQEVINLVQRLGFSIKETIASVDVSSANLTPSLMETLEESERNMISNNTTLQMARLNEMLLSPQTVTRRDVDEYGNRHAITSTYQPGTSEAIDAVFSNMSDEDIVNMFAGDQQSARMAIALKNQRIGLADWNRYSEKFMTGRPAESADYALMMQGIFGDSMSFGTGFSGSFISPNARTDAWNNPVIQQAMQWYGATISSDPSVNNELVGIQKDQLMDLDGGSVVYNLLGQLYSALQTGTGDPVSILNNLIDATRTLGQSLLDLDASHLYEGLEFAKEMEAAFRSVTGSINSAKVALADAHDEQAEYNDKIAAMRRLQAGGQSASDRKRDLGIIKQYSKRDLEALYKSKDKHGKTGDQNEDYLAALRNANTRLEREGEQLAAERAGILDGLTSELSEEQQVELNTAVQASGGKISMDQAFALLE